MDVMDVMDVAIYWLGLGAMIGIGAAAKRGFHPTIGGIGGALLGPLALLMYFATDNSKECPYCAESVPKETSVCLNCKKDIGQPNPDAQLG